MNLSIAPEAGPLRPTGKSAAAFRTIAEVASDLELPAHVLRFWESKFPQIKPLKRRGGRRYYRPEDVALLRRIRSFLYTEGYTIKGVQRLLRESGGRTLPLPADVIADDRLPVMPAAQAGEATAETTDRQALCAVLDELEALRALLRQQGF